MTSKRLSLALILSATLFVSAGFAADKKLDRDNRWRDWNDSSLQNGDLPAAGSSVSSGSSGFQWSGASGSFGSSPILGSPSTPDNWNGGTGNWSNAGNWSTGSPGPTNDVTIYSGGNDLVTLDVGSTTVNSLTLGGGGNGTTSELTDGGVAQTLAITSGLTVGQTGFLNLLGSTTVSAGTLNNSGDVYVFPGATLNLTNQPSGITDVVVGSIFLIYGNFTAGSNSAFANLNSIEGHLLLVNGQTTNITPGGGTLTLSDSGDFSVGASSTVSISGNVLNNGILATSYFAVGPNDTLNISGTLTNNGQFYVFTTGDMGILGGLANSGTVGVNGGGTLKINGAADNSGILETGFYAHFGGNTVTVTGLLTNEATGQINLYGSGDVLQALGGLTNHGLITVNNGSSIDPPFLNNLGIINIDSTSKFVVGTGSPSGLGYIQLANGTLGEIINPTGYGVINVNGSALLAGTLDILLQGGFNPGVGSTYKFLLFNSGQLTGIFGNIENDLFNGGTEKWLVNYDSGDGYVELIAENNGTPVPEPATLLVLTPGLLAVGYVLRRKLFA